MNTFLLILTVCGSLHTGNNSCEEFVIDTDQSQIECLTSIKAIYNNQPTPAKEHMNDAINDWFVSVSKTNLDCIIEDKE